MGSVVSRLCDSGLQIVILTLALEVGQTKPRGSSGFYQPAKCAYGLSCVPSPGSDMADIGT